jgi:hypothetical protein
MKKHKQLANSVDVLNHAFYSILSFVVENPKVLVTFSINRDTLDGPPKDGCRTFTLGPRTLTLTIKE